MSSYTWEDVADPYGGTFTKAEKEAKAKEWNEAVAVGGSHDQHEASANRSQRDALLAGTDWYALSDVTLSDEMKTYRQALRDLPKHSDWPNLADSDWPTKP